MTTQNTQVPAAAGGEQKTEPKPKRIFVIEGQEYEDPDPALSVDEVRRHFVDFFPELANAETSSSKRGIDDAHTFSKRVGTKG